MTRFPG
jgi:hypothetical protein